MYTSSTVLREEAALHIRVRGLRLLVTYNGVYGLSPAT